MNTYTGLVICLLVCICSHINSASGNKCTNKRGRCQNIRNRCSGGRYERNLCPGGYDIRCCVPSGGSSSNKCASKRGRCQSTRNKCSGGHYEKGLCSGGYGTRCCVPGGTRGGSCSSSSAKSYACQVLAKHRAGQLVLANRHPSGVPDDAHPLKNIEDACNGRKVLRSSYVCRECSTGAPGGYVCLSSKLLQYINNLSKYGKVYITSIAGACHSCKSRHYRGLAVDMSRTGRYSSYMNECRRLGGWALDERSHIHCQFY